MNSAAVNINSCWHSKGRKQKLNKPLHLKYRKWNLLQKAWNRRETLYYISYPFHFKNIRALFNNLVK